MKRSDIPDGVNDEPGWLLLKTIDDHAEGLTEWEINFVESVTKQLKQGKFLSEKQQEVLDRIEQEKCE